jgi:CubicO group peptidase (beta-lactamase class C family)
MQLRMLCHGARAVHSRILEHFERGMQSWPAQIQSARQLACGMIVALPSRARPRRVRRRSPRRRGPKRLAQHLGGLDVLRASEGTAARPCGHGGCGHWTADMERVGWRAVRGGVQAGQEFRQDRCARRGAAAKDGRVAIARRALRWRGEIETGRCRCR